MAQLRLVETHLNFIFSGLLCPVDVRELVIIQLFNRQHTPPGPPRRSGSRTSRHRPERAESREDGGGRGLRFAVEAFERYGRVCAVTELRGVLESRPTGLRRPRVSEYPF